MKIFFKKTNLKISIKKNHNKKKIVKLILNKTASKVFREKIQIVFLDNFQQNFCPHRFFFRYECPKARYLLNQFRIISRLNSQNDTPKNFGFQKKLRPSGKISTFQTPAYDTKIWKILLLLILFLQLRKQKYKENSIQIPFKG